MKKALLIVVVVLAVAFFVGNSESILQFGTTLATGATVPLVLAVVATVARYLTQAQSYNLGFEAVGYKTGFWHNVKLILSLVFINTFCLFSGATGLVFIIDDAHREGADSGTASTGAILTQIGFFAALFVITILGMVVMFFLGTPNAVFLTGAGILALVLVALCSFYVVGYFFPSPLRRFMTLVERVLRKLFGLFKHELRENWGVEQADSFIDASKVLAKNPFGVVKTIAFATVSAFCNMLCLVFIGFSFGYDNVATLVAAFAMAAVSIQISPTPQGIGVTEAVITWILTGDGASMTQAAAIALVYRGIMLWLPFFIGAFFLSQMGFFKGSGKEKTDETRKNDVGWVSGAIMLILGGVNIALALFEDQLLPYAALTQFVGLQGIPLPIFWLHLLGGIAIVFLAISLIKRWREGWVASASIMAVLAAVELYFGVVTVAIAFAALVIWLLFQRRAFDKVGPLERKYANGREPTAVS